MRIFAHNFPNTNLKSTIYSVRRKTLDADYMRETTGHNDCDDDEDDDDDDDGIQ